MERALRGLGVRSGRVATGRGNDFASAAAADHSHGASLVASELAGVRAVVARFPRCVVRRSVCQTEGRVGSIVHAFHIVVSRCLVRDHLPFDRCRAYNLLRITRHVRFPARPPAAMRTRKNRLSLLVAILSLCAFAACDQPTKPIKKLDIKRAADMEPISPPPREATEPEAAGEDVAQPGEEMEVVDVGGFRGTCDGAFAGINAEDLVTLRSGSQVGTYRLAGISIPAEVRSEAHNQIRIWLERKSVSLEVDESVPAIDPAVYVHVCPEGTIVNEELVRAGLAMPSEARFRRSDALKKVSVEALTAGRGVWGKKAQ